MIEKPKKTVDDIPSTIDLTKHTSLTEPGTIFYRVLPKDCDPRIGSGQLSRCAKNPNNLSVEQFLSESRAGRGSYVGTSSTYCSLTPVTAYREALGNNDRDIDKLICYKIKINEPIKVTDSDSICESEKVDKPYTTPNKREEYYHSFCGKGVQALKYSSAFDSKGQNVVLFGDNIPSYLTIVSCEKCTDKEMSDIKKIIQNENKS